MRENYDYVTMTTYSADMAESTERTVIAISKLRKRVAQAERALAEIVLAAGGAVNVSERNLHDRDRKIELTIWRNDADMSVRFTAVV